MLLTISIAEVLWVKGNKELLHYKVMESFKLEYFEYIRSIFHHIWKSKQIYSLSLPWKGKGAESPLLKGKRKLGYRQSGCSNLDIFSMWCEPSEICSTGRAVSINFLE